MSIIKNLINKKTWNNKEPTALCCFYDGRFDSQLAEIGIKLIGCKNHSLYDWSESSKSSNITVITEQEIPNYSYDFVICNDIIQQRDHLLRFTRGLHLPGIVVNHESFRETAYHLKQRLREANAELISTEYQDPNGIPYGTEELSDVEKDIEVLIEGNFQPTDYPVIQSLKSAIPELTLVGHNPGLDFSIEPLSYKQYRKYFARAKTFINLPTQRNIGHQLLWAMSNGALVISLKTPVVEGILNDSNGVLCTHPTQLAGIANDYKGKETSRRNRAKEINKIFPLATFKEKWKPIIDTYTKKVFIYEQR